MKNTSRKKVKVITAAEFDKMFDSGKDITDYLDFDKVTVVKRVNVDFPSWVIDRLDREAKKLNISRQAVIKMWINDRISIGHPARSAAYGKLESLKETLDILSDPAAMAGIRRGEKDLKEGRTRPWREVKRSLGLSSARRAAVR